MFHVYILKSVKSNHFYIGHTHNLDNRIADHNTGKVKSTRKYIPWKVVYTEIFTTKSEAYKRERQIKSYKGGNAFKDLVKEVSG